MKTPSRADQYRKRADDAGAGIKARRKSERELRKKQKALNDMADNEDWLDGKAPPKPSK